MKYIETLSLSIFTRSNLRKIGFRLVEWKTYSLVVCYFYSEHESMDFELIFTVHNICPSQNMSGFVEFFVNWLTELG